MCRLRTAETLVTLLIDMVIDMQVVDADRQQLALADAHVAV